MRELIKKNYKKYKIVYFVFLSYFITWIYIVPKALQSHDIILFEIPFILEIIAAFGPAIAAIIVTSLVSKRDGVLKLLSRIKIVRVEFKWYLISLFGQPVIWLTAILIYVLLGGETPSFTNTPFHKMVNLGGSLNLIILIAMLFFQQFLSLFGEEVGWRGYLLPKLLETKRWVTSSLIIGFIWAIWHLPLFFIQGRTQVDIPVLWYFIDLIASTVFFTWIFLNTRGSVFIATLLHASINTSTVLLPILPIAVGNESPFLIGVCLKVVICIVLIVLKRDDFNDLKHQRSRITL